MTTPKNIRNKPDFIHIGPGRTGSSMIYEAFNEHPEICLAKNIRVTNYFSSEYNRGQDWYYSFFKQCDTKKSIGEMGSNYFYDPLSPKRIHEELPNVKLISVLRDPFERLISSYNYRRRASIIDPNINIDDALLKYPDLVSDNLYAEQMERFHEYFIKEKYLILFYEDLKADPHFFLEQIYNFIGVSSSEKSLVANKKINSSSLLRYNSFGPLMRPMINWLRNTQQHALLDQLQRNTVIRAILFKEHKVINPTELMSTDSIKMLRDVYHPQIESIENMTGRNLDSWRR